MSKRGEKTRNGNKWTEARFRSFVTGALRRAAWPVKFAVINEAYVGSKKNQATGRMRKMFMCDHCKKLFPQNEMQADHINPVVDPEVGFQDWNEWISRMFVEIDGYQALCNECHNLKTAEEKAVAAERRSRKE